MKASLETSALFLSTTLELKNFVSADLKCHCFLLQNFRSKDSSRSFSDLKPLAHSNQCSDFLDYPETFHAIRKLSGPSGKYPDYPETF